MNYDISSILQFGPPSMNSWLRPRLACSKRLSSYKAKFEITTYSDGWNMHSMWWSSGNSYELSLVMWSCLVCMEVRSWLQRFVPKTVQVFCGSCWSHAPTRLGLSYSSVFYYPLVSLAAAKSSERTPTFLAASWDWC